RPSVRELDRVAAHTSGISTVFVVLEGSDGPALRRAADSLVSALEQVGPPWVGGAEDGVQDVARFLEPRAGLFADLKGLEQLRDDGVARYDYEVSKVTGTALDLDEEAPPEIDAELVRKRLGVDEAAEKRFPGGYYQSADGRTVVVAIRSGVLATDLDQG